MTANVSSYKFLLFSIYAMEGLKGKTVVVTGGAGFIGSHLSERLVAEGAEVHTLDIVYDLRNLSSIIKKIEHHRTDICDANSVKELFADINPDKVFHLAAYINPDRNPKIIKKSMDVNFYGTLNILEGLRGTNVETIVYASTSDVYGSNKPPLREDQSPDPISPYSISKAAGETLCRHYFKTFKLPIVIMRPVLTYGPRQNAAFLIPNAIVSALRKREFKSTKGEQQRAVNFVSDTVDGFMRSSIAPKAIGDTINIGAERTHSVASIIKEIANLCGSDIDTHIGELPYRENEIWNVSCDSTKARRLLGWEQKTELRDGLKKTVEWYRNEYAR